ncbi:hypothetical protein JD844_020364 [Phrynosoma platyrhinos]|uniref:Histone 3 n=1 Tax=Phrynosoma platyrhinos TaxID=52577 RepID=A0ABQ7SSB9_PHRPL|nr:hypothetical protein JD844_020364 [Phrynosoma platyrhinos]
MPCQGPTIPTQTRNLLRGEISQVAIQGDFLGPIQERQACFLEHQVLTQVHQEDIQEHQAHTLERHQHQAHILGAPQHQVGILVHQELSHLGHQGCILPLDSHQVMAEHSLQPPRLDRDLEPLLHLEALLLHCSRITKVPCDIPLQSGLMPRLLITIVGTVNSRPNK